MQGTSTLPEVHPHNLQDVPLVELMNFVFTCMPGESYWRQLRFLLLCLCAVLSSADQLLCVLLLHKCCGPRSVSFLVKPGLFILKQHVIVIVQVDKLWCLRTSKLLELIWSLVIQSAREVQIYHHSAMKLNPSEECEFWCQVSSDVLLFTHTIELNHTHTRTHTESLRFVTFRPL